MLKKMTLFLMLILLLVYTPVMAFEQQPAVYKSTITVTEEGGRYQIGFINVEFKKESLDATKLPITFEVSVYAENGINYIDFQPGVDQFYKDVHIRIDKFDGIIYDQATEVNIPLTTKNEQLVVEHFSRYAF